jgi:hypothetical protein
VPDPRPMTEVSFADALAEARAALHLDVTCPVCRAGFSEPCRSSSGAVRIQAHGERARPAAQWTQGEMFASA